MDRKPGCVANSLVVDYDLSQSDQSELSICIACNNAKGWSKAGIRERVQGKTTLSPEDPFENTEAILI